MFQIQRPSCLIAACALLMVLAASAAEAIGPAPTCGAGVPCQCGDRVVASVTLSSADPVCSAVCPGNGLFVADGVTLDLGGCTITGDGAGPDVGLTIENPANNVVIRNGRVTGFGTGVATWLATSGSTLADLHIVENGAGIRISATGSTIRNSVLQRNDGHCIQVVGDENAVTSNRCEASEGKGVVVEGELNVVTGNWALRGRAEGFDIGGSQNTVSQNRASDNFGEGFRFQGSGHAVDLNYSLRNEDSGYVVEATQSRFDRNRGDYSIGWGILDTTRGGGTGGTANTYANTNRCTGNLLGKSFPAGLCR